MRTPLNGVIGMINLLQRTRLDGAQRAYAENARQSAEHLLGLVNDLLDYARLEAGALEFDLAPVDLEGLVRGVAELLSPRAHDKGLEIVWSVAADAPDVVADEARDELVAAHADRAVHAPQRRIQVEARERARPRDGMVVRRVDEGAVDVEQDGVDGPGSLLRIVSHPTILARSRHPTQ